MADNQDRDEVVESERRRSPRVPRARAALLPVLLVTSLMAGFIAPAAAEAASSGTTSVLVTHDQTEALTMSDRVAVFNDGVIQQLAPPDELYEAPLNSFVAQFIGENNALEGVVAAIGDGRCVVRLDGGQEIDA